MLQFIFGFAIPNSNANTQTTNQNQTEISETTNSADTGIDGEHNGGETPTPPKK